MPERMMMEETLQLILNKLDKMEGSINILKESQVIIQPLASAKAYRT